MSRVMLPWRLGKAAGQLSCTRLLIKSFSTGVGSNRLDAISSGERVNWVRRGSNFAGAAGFHISAVAAFRAGEWNRVGRKAPAMRGDEEEEIDPEELKYLGEEKEDVDAEEVDNEDENWDGTPREKGRKAKKHPYPNPHNIPPMPIIQTLELKRTATVKKGGKLITFSALVCIGNGKGALAIGKGKHREAVKAIENATRKAHTFHAMEYFQLYDNRTLMHDITTSFKKTKVIVLASKEGMGLRAPEVVRKMCECVGIQDIQVKFHGSRNTRAMAKAFWNALKEQQSPEEISRMRGKAVVDTAMLRGGYGLGHTTVFTLPNNVKSQSS